MGRGRLTEQERKQLMENPFVSYVTETRVIYTTDFKRHFMKEYNSGKGPSTIFREAGFDLKVLGTKRIERAAARWKESYASGTLGDYDHISAGQIRE